MDVALAMTIEWSFNRYSFGRPLASYQELKHRFADMKMWLEASHAIADAAARPVKDDHPRACELVSAGQAYIGHYGPELMHDCVQMHGGIGVTFDHDLHLYLRRVVLGSQLFGTVREHRDRLTQILESERPPHDPDVRSGRGDLRMDVEPLEEFRRRLRAWLKENMPRADGRAPTSASAKSSPTRRNSPRSRRAVSSSACSSRAASPDWSSRRSTAVPGLTPAHAEVLNQEIVGYQYPSRYQVPTMTPCLAVILEFGTDEQKRRGSRGSSTATTSGCRCCRSPRVDPTSPVPRPAPCGTASSGS